jgi:hypothetical protein
MFNNFFFFFSKNRADYEIMWKNVVEWDRPHMTIWHMCIACHIPKATNTHSECVITIDFPLQKRLLKGISVFRYTYIACLVVF